MSSIGKNSIHFTKKDLQDQKIPAIGFKKVQFYHEPTIGDTEIDLTALVLPSSGIPVAFTNPSASDLAAAKLLFNSKNITLVSSYKGLLGFDDYTITSNTKIALKDATVATELVWAIIDPVAKTGLQVVDVDPIVVTAELAAEADEVIVGKPFDINKYSTTQQGSILVFLDGQLMARNVGNQQSASGDGDYYEVDPGGTAVGNSIKFNQTSLSARSVMVISNGLAFAAPNDSLVAQIESLATQVDLVIPTVAALAGVPESDFQGAPNSVDLAAFGQRMTTAEADINTLDADLSEGGDSANGPLLATTSVAGAVKKNKFQHKVLSSDVTSTGVIASLTFNNLVIGRTYRAVVHAHLSATSDDDCGVIIQHDSVFIGKARLQDTDTTKTASQMADSSATFTATATTLEFFGSSLSANGVLLGNGGREETFVTLIELNNYESETTDFT